jgi:hypothetical protein
MLLVTASRLQDLKFFHFVSQYLTVHGGSFKVFKVMILGLLSSPFRVTKTDIF